MARLALTGTRVRDRRLLLGMKQADLARAAGVSPAYINLIEHNRRRVGPDLLAALADALAVEPAALAEGAEGPLFDALREAAATGEAGLQPEIDRAEEFVGRFPGWAGLLAVRQGQVARLTREIAALSDRLAQDPFLSASLHEVLSVVTSLHASSAILAETEDIEPEWRSRFHRNIHADSERLAGASAALVSYLDQERAPETALASPQEEFERWLAGQAYHIAALERAQAPGPASLAEAVSGVAARALAAEYLGRYRADALALPLDRLAGALATHGADPVRLAAELDAPFPLVLRRLACLPPGVCPEGLGLVVCDASGTLVFRRPTAGFALPRFGAACALWPLYEALAQPVTPVFRLIETAGRGAGLRFAAHAWCDRAFPGGYGGPAVAQIGRAHV